MITSASDLSIRERFVVVTVAGGGSTGRNSRIYTTTRTDSELNREFLSGFRIILIATYKRSITAVSRVVVQVPGEFVVVGCPGRGLQLVSIYLKMERMVIPKKVLV